MGLDAGYWMLDPSQRNLKGNAEDDALPWDRTTESHRRFEPQRRKDREDHRKERNDHRILWNGHRNVANTKAL